MDSGLQTLTDRDASLPERHVPPRQPYHDQYRLPVEDQGYVADTSNRKLQKHDGDMLSTNHKMYRLPFGWTPVIFALVVGVLTAIAVAVAVGGGVGGSLASSKRDCATSTSQSSSESPNTSSLSASSSATSATATTAATDFAPPPIQNIKSLQFPCPNVDEHDYSTIRGQKFKMTCKTMYTGSDIANIWVYTLEDCIQVCSAFNNFAPGSDVPGYGATTCQHLLYETWVDGGHGAQWANCYLKGANATTLSLSGGDGYSVGADLVIT